MEHPGRAEQRRLDRGRDPLAAGEHHGRAPCPWRVVLGVALVATAPLADLPEAMLAATLVFIATKLFRVGELAAELRRR
jgi:hypothetical protein